MKKSLVRMSPVLKEVVVGDGVGGHFHDRQQKHSLGQTQRGDTRRAQLCMSPGQQTTISMLTAPHAYIQVQQTPLALHKQESVIRRQTFRVREKKTKKLKIRFGSLQLGSYFCRFLNLFSFVVVQLIAEIWEHFNSTSEEFFEVKLKTSTI